MNMDMNVKRIAIVYPWSDPSDMGRGSALRVGLLAKYLKTRYEEVRLLSIDASSRDFHGVQGLSYEQSPSCANAERLFLPALQTLAAGRLPGEKPGQNLPSTAIPALLLRSGVRFSPAQNGELGRCHSRGIYLFRLPDNSRGEKAGKKVIVTDHDVIAHDPENSRSGSYIKRAVLGKELKALREADCAVSVCEADRDAFLRYGVRTLCIPHGIEIRATDTAPSREELARQLADNYSIEIPARPVCLFVGSRILPNVEAAHAIESMAAAWPGKPPETGEGEIPLFIVAGGCMREGRGPSLLALGQVDEKALELLYPLADIIVIPLARGTGSSLKTIEAMARGKPILGTSVAFRGYPVADGNNCVIEDDLGKYPERIAALLAEPEARERLGEAARLFASAYDYRIVYKTYADCIDRMAGS